MFTLEWYHAMFLMKSMIFMHSTPSTMINYVAMIAGKDSPKKSFIRHVTGLYFIQILGIH